MIFKSRSYQKELLDEKDIPFADIKQNMQELQVINQYLGGHRITRKGVAKLLADHNFLKTPCRIVEVGCGGGDNLQAIKAWALQKGIAVELTGIDYNPECILFARAQSRNAGICFICSDYRLATFDKPPHIVFSSLFCHHFTDEELIGLLRWKQSNSEIGFFINDLHRHPVAYKTIQTLTSLFSKSYLVKNDAPLSVKRGFVKKDWQLLLQEAGIAGATIRWQWAFRWLITYRK